MFNGEIVTFNIGGQIYSTKRSTIENNVDSQSHLALIIRNRTETNRDEHGRYFLDRDGNLFRYILNYFRDQQLVLPENFTELKQLCAEAKFYQIDRLVNEIENRLNTQNEHRKEIRSGVNFTLISNLHQAGRIRTLIGPLNLVSLFSLQPISRSFLKILEKFTSPANISCQCTFPTDENLISCQPFDPLQRIVLAKQARKMGLVVSYTDDYIYLPIERSIMARDELAQRFLNHCDGKLLHMNVACEKTTENNYTLVENWFLPNISIRKCENSNGLSGSDGF